MGFSTIIDILGSSIIGGMLLMILFRIDDSAVKNTYTYGGELIVQQNLVDLVQILEYDFKKIGYCKNWEAIPDPSKSILSADSNSISFFTDVDYDGIPDTVHYYIGALSELASTPNPNDRILYRVVNSEVPRGSNMGVTLFHLTYYNSLGNELTVPVLVPGEITTMQIDIKVENYAAYENEYSTIFWRQIRMAARNLRNR